MARRYPPLIYMAVSKTDRPKATRKEYLRRTMVCSSELGAQLGEMGVVVLGEAGQRMDEGLTW